MTRFFCLLAVLMVACTQTPQPAPVAEDAGGGYWVYYGTYPKETSKGIYRSQFDPSTGKISAPELAAELRDPSFLAIHPNQSYLYAVSEVDDFDEEGSGSISAYSLDRSSGGIRHLNTVSTRGSWPCHLDVDPSGKVVAVANYRSGSVASFAINADGSLSESASFIQHEGSSVHPRQEGPHAHSTDFSADGRFLITSDLGMDQVLVYSANPTEATLTPNDPPHVEAAAGSGPRHFAFHPNGRYAYSINELALTVTAFNWNSQAGTLERIETLSTLPEGAAGDNFSTAEIEVHPSGKFLYGSNRGHDSIAVFSIDESTGKIVLIQNAPTQGMTPRHFAIGPEGRFLFAANQNSDTVVLFEIDQQSGKLDATGEVVQLDAPVCLKFVPVPESS